MHSIRHFFFFLLFNILFALNTTIISAQSVGIGANSFTPDASSMLEVQSTTKGLLIPRIALTQTTSASPVSSPLTSLLIYNTATVNDVKPGYYYWDGSKWVRFNSLNGGAGTLNYVPKWTPDGTTLGNSQIFDNGTNVGIGTSSPTAKIHINGGIIRMADVSGQSPFDIRSYDNAKSLWLISNIAANSKIVIGTAHDWDSQISILYTPGTIGATTGDLAIGQMDKNNSNWTHGVTRFLTNGGERMRITSNGSIGIGTNSPSAQLHTTGSVRFQNYTNGFLQVDGSGNVSVGTGSALFTAGTGLTWSSTTLNSVWTASGNNIYNNNSGNVGIGTTSPGYKLDINGNVNIAANSALTFGTTPNTRSFRASGTGDLTIPLGKFSAGTSLFIRAYAGGGWAELGSQYIISRSWGSSNPVVTQVVDGGIGNRIKFYHYGDNGYFYLFATWDNQSPSESYNNTVDLIISATSSWTADYGTFASSSEITAYGEYVNSGGNVGIGTTSPSAQLHTTGTVRFQNYVSGSLQVDANGNLSVGTGSSLFTAGTGLSWSGTTLNSVWTTSGSNIYNNNSGNVGIGTTAPLSKLQVKSGKVYFNQLSNDPSPSYIAADLVLGDDVSTRNGYGGTNGSNLLLQSNDKSTITALDQGNNLGQISFQNLSWTIGEDIGWGTQTIKLPNLAGNGNRFVYANANGVLSAASSSPWVANNYNGSYQEITLSSSGQYWVRIVGGTGYSANVWISRAVHENFSWAGQLSARVTGTGGGWGTHGGKIVLNVDKSGENSSSQLLYRVAYGEYTGDPSASDGLYVLLEGGGRTYHFYGATEATNIGTDGSFTKGGLWREFSLPQGGVHGTYGDSYGTIIGGGNVGIGITSPNYKLDINGAMNCNDIVGQTFAGDKSIGTEPAVTWTQTRSVTITKERSDTPIIINADFKGVTNSGYIVCAARIRRSSSTIGWNYGGAYGSGYSSGTSVVAYEAGLPAGSYTYTLEYASTYSTHIGSTLIAFELKQ